MADIKQVRYIGYEDEAIKITDAFLDDCKRAQVFREWVGMRRTDVSVSVIDEGGVILEFLVRGLRRKIMICRPNTWLVRQKNGIFYNYSDEEFYGTYSIKQEDVK